MLEYLEYAAKGAAEEQLGKVISEAMKSEFRCRPVRPLR